MTEIFCDPLAPIALVLLKLLFNPLAELKPESKFATSHNQNSFKRFFFFQNILQEHKTVIRSDAHENHWRFKKNT